MEGVLGRGTQESMIGGRDQPVGLELVELRGGRREKVVTVGILDLETKWLCSDDEDQNEGITMKLYSPF